MTQGLNFFDDPADTDPEDEVFDGDELRAGSSTIDATDDAGVTTTVGTGKYAVLAVPDYDSRDGRQISYLSVGASPGFTGGHGGHDFSGNPWATFKGDTIGWRDHTDGKRCTTTTGDRIDVVGQSYRLHVRKKDDDTDALVDVIDTYPVKQADGTFKPKPIDSTSEHEFVEGDEAFLRLGKSDRIYEPAWFKTVTATRTRDDLLADIAKIKGVDPKFTWEDHTYGDRLTTTRGHKIEAIKGNYYLYVFHEGSSDVQHALNYTQDEMSEYFSGSWKEETVGPKVWSKTGTEQPATDKYKDDTRPVTLEQTWAKATLSETYVGRNTWPAAKGKFLEAPDIETDAAGNKIPPERINKYSLEGVPYGEAHERTYAKALRSFTGDAGNRVEEIEDTTYATAITETTHATTISETTMAGTIRSSTGDAGATVTLIEDKTYAVTINSTTKADAISETTTVDTATSITTGLAFFDLTAGAAVTGLTAGGLYLDVIVAGVLAEAKIAPILFDIKIGRIIEWTPLKDGYTKVQREAAELKQTTAMVANIKALSVDIGAPDPFPNVDVIDDVARASY